MLGLPVCDEMGRLVLLETQSSHDGVYACLAKLVAIC